MRRIALLLLAACCLSVGALAQEKSEKPVVISGYLFGDYYSVVSHHDPAVEGKNGFWVRRGYLTFDRSLSDAFAARVRFEINQAGDFRSNTTLEPYIKDAWLRWRYSPKLDVYAGLAPSPTWENVERVWGYRSVEKTPVDLYRLGSSRDLGISVVGSFDDAKRYRYHLQAGNGSGTGSETNEEKKVSASFAYVPAKTAIFEVYADHDSRPGGDDRTLFQAFAAYEREDLRAGVQFVHQKRQSGDINVASVFGVMDVRPNIAVLARVDRNFDPFPDGDRIDYLPFSRSSASTFFLLGADWKVHKNVSVIPNVEVVRYDERADMTLIPRVTLFFTF